MLLGGGGHCKVVIDNLRLREKVIVGILDDNPETWGKEICGCRVMGSISELVYYKGKVDFAVIAMTDPVTRRVMDHQCRELDIETTGFVHPTAVISRTASVSGKAQVCSSAVINPDGVVKDHAIINTAAVVEHDCFVGEYCHIAPVAKLLGRVRVGEGCMVGASATILQNLKVGEGAVIGAGSLVTRDAEAGWKYMGIPARKVGKVNEYQ